MTKILIAEDNPDLRDILALAFGQQYEVTLAEDGEAAIERLTQYTPDILVLDINMPRASGFDVLKYISQIDKLRDMKVMVLTGNTIAMQSEEAQIADLFLVKPVDLKELMTLVTRLTNQPRSA